ncbi:PRELI domain containing protein 3B-like [Mytilus californianus]|uniref:PRELI domain containing protein 3A,Protein slowmo,PRELI domain containing protein 3B n=1 Tax=Mytilus coruscus TaxID=42192 RepID=A0A6J8DZE6_MYTCO|nr:PRELI domain containing protein 3B-like [Mytilus californianus]CAC5413128.1 PRELI domain containing protein 3A,Protein slowmo,PRELI domain containing protein 3B [Mytilus coruscus]
MKIWTSEHTFEHSWDTIVQAAWKKYPNPLNPAVIGTDVLDRKVDNKGVLKTHRLMTTQWGLPNWAKKILGQDENAYGSEHSEVDPKAKTMTLKSKNLTWCNLVTIDEKLVYAPHPEDSSKTHLKQEAVVNIKGVPLSSYLENMITQNINNNAQKGREGLEWVVRKIKVEAETLQTEAATFTKDTFHTIHKVESLFNRDGSL